MTRTTLPRPFDVAALFPGIAALARRATRLHPRGGAPTVHDSSAGGPLLWPAGEPWPVCDEEHAVPPGPGWLLTPDEVRLKRRLLALGPARRTAEEEALLAGIGHGRTPGPAGPVPLVAVAQLYARDVPGLAGPAGADVAQVLWCPFGHGEEVLPAVRIVWRRAAEVTDVLPAAPEPALISGHEWLVNPCLLHPEQIVEYPAPHELPRDLRARVHAWEEATGRTAEGSYQQDLGVAPGWKLGGWAPWSFCEPWPAVCTSCGASMTPFLTVASSEWGGASDSWCPAEDQGTEIDYNALDNPLEPTLVHFGDDDNLQIYTCPASFDHPPLTREQ